MNLRVDCLKYLDLSDNNLSSIAAQALIDFVLTEKSVVLETLKLKSTYLCLNSEILSSLPKVPNLRRVDLQHNTIGFTAL